MRGCEVVQTERWIWGEYWILESVPCTRNQLGVESVPASEQAKGDANVGAYCRGLANQVAPGWGWFD